MPAASVEAVVRAYMDNLHARRPDARAAEVACAPAHLLDLMYDLLLLCLTGLTHIEILRASRTCRYFNKAAGAKFAACRSADVCTLGFAYVHGLVSFRRFLSEIGVSRVRWLIGNEGIPFEKDALHVTSLMFRPLSGLAELSLRGLSGVSDEVVSAALVPNLPTLCVLDLSETCVATAGVLSLGALPQLHSLDITYCALVSYAAVVALRETSGSLRAGIIRRQPCWLDGHFETPWGEEHTYWPCGAFAFHGRDRQSNEDEVDENDEMAILSAKLGWTAQLRRRGGRPDLDKPYGASLRERHCTVDELVLPSDATTGEARGLTTHIEDRLIFVDGRFSFNNGRLGVSLCPYGDGRVVVVQSREQPEPPRGTIPVLRSADGMPEEGQVGFSADCMVSLMRVRPLDADASRAPPAVLQMVLREFCVGRNADGLSRRCPLERTAFFSCHVDHESGFLSPDLEQQVDRVATSRLVREDDLLLLTEAVVQRRIRATNTSPRREVASQALSDRRLGSAASAPSGCSEPTES